MAMNSCFSEFNFVDLALIDAQDSGQKTGKPIKYDTPQAGYTAPRAVE